MGRTMRSRKVGAVTSESAAAPKGEQTSKTVKTKGSASEEGSGSSIATMTEYEMLRAMRIARNAAVLAEMGVKDDMEELSRNASLAKRSMTPHKGLQRPDRQKRAKESNEPVVIRRSLRAQGMLPSGDSTAGLTGGNQHRDGGTSTAIFDTRPQGDVAMRSMENPEAADERLRAQLRNLRDGLVSVSDRALVKQPKDAEVHGLHLSRQDVAKVAKERIFCAAFLPTKNRLVAAAGDKAGHVSLWDLDPESDPPSTTTEDEHESYDGVHVFRPHSKPVSAIEIHSNDVSKVYSCSFDGSVRVTDVERGVFAELHVDASSDFSAMGLSPCGHVAYIGDGDGDLSILDLRAKKAVSEHGLHTAKVNSVQFNPQRENLLLTSSTDKTVKLWDVRRWDATSSGGCHSPAKSASSSAPLAVLSHSRAANSAYFSPDGNRLASTSYDDCVKVWDNVLAWSDQATLASKHYITMNLPTVIHHDNQTGRWISSFRAVWCWDSRHLFVGNMKRALDVITPEHSKQRPLELRSDFLTTIPARLGVHPSLPVVAGGGGTKLFVWRSS